MVVTALPDVPLLHPAREAVGDALVAAADRVAEAFGTADPSARAGSLDWTVQQLAAHLATGVDEYVAMLTGGATRLTDMTRRQAVADANLAAEAATPVADLAARLRAGVDRLAALVRGEGTGEVPFYDVVLPVALVGAVFLGELLVHGHDLARLPIPDDAAAMAAAGALSILPTVLVPGTAPRQVRIGVEVRGHGSVVLAVDGDVAALEAGPAPVDVRLSAEPVPFLLTSYQRTKPLGPMLRRRLSVGGRRPWRLAALQSRFASA